MLFLLYFGWIGFNVIRFISFCTLFLSFAAFAVENIRNCPRLDKISFYDFDNYICFIDVLKFLIHKIYTILVTTHLFSFKTPHFTLESKLLKYLSTASFWNLPIYISVYATTYKNEMLSNGFLYVDSNIFLGKLLKCLML